MEGRRSRDSESAKPLDGKALCRAAQIANHKSQVTNPFLPNFSRFPPSKEQEWKEAMQQGGDGLPDGVVEGLKEEAVMNGKQRIVWIVLASCLAAVVMRGIERHGRHGMSVSTERDGLIDDCRQMRVTFDDAEAARAEQTLSGPAPRGALRFRAPANSGIFVLGADRSDVSVTACKAAAAEQDLSRIAVSFEGGELVVRGPESQNGPISVRLAGNRWDGRLEAHARNGPLSLSLPEGYASAVSVQSSGRSPFQCRAKACGEARKNWDEDSRRIEFGDSSAPVVRLTTVNGPVSIRSDRPEED
jgi:hypothetical protein